MVIMDFNVVTWVTNVYQKFETMCLEVEEIIVQDTVKHVENQVQMVGTSVKKFYSDAVQDLCLEPSVDSIKSSPVSALHEYAPLCSFEKIQETTNEEEDKKDGNVPRFDVLQTGQNSFNLSSQNPAKGACSESYRRKYDDRGTYRKTKLGAKRISRKENSCQVTRLENHVKKDLREGSRVRCPSDRDRESFHDPEIIRLNEPLDEVNRLTTNAVESLGTKESEIEQIVAESVAADVLRIDEVHSKASLLLKADVSQELFGESVDSANHPGEIDEQRTDAIKTSNVLEQKHEILQQLRQNPLEQSCVLVNQDDIRFVPSMDGKHSPYKKNIRGAISSRMRSSRKREYEQLAVLQRHEEEYGESNQGPEPVCTRHNCESDWELL